METEKKAIIESCDSLVKAGSMERRIEGGEPWYRLAAAGQSVARAIGMPYSDGAWRHWREWIAFEAGDLNPDEIRGALAQLVQKGLVERQRRPDGESAYQIVEQGNAN